MALDLHPNQLRMLITSQGDFLVKTVTEQVASAKYSGKHLLGIAKEAVRLAEELVKKEEQANDEDRS